MGAFRLPLGGNRPKTFEYGGTAMTCRQDAGGSLFISGHVRLAYGELRDGGQIVEASIPRPAHARSATCHEPASFNASTMSPGAGSGDRTRFPGWDCCA